MATRSSAGLGTYSTYQKKDGSLTHRRQVTVKDRQTGLTTRVPLSAPSKKEVDAMAMKLIRESEVKGYVNDKAVRVPQVVAAWLLAENNKAATTMDGYQRALRRHIKPFLNIPVGQLNGARMKTFLLQTAASTQGSPYAIDGKATAKMAFDALRAAMAWAVTEESTIRISVNPLADVKFTLGRTRRREQMPLDDALGIVEAAEGMPSQLVWRMLMATGARRGEILGLDVHHVDVRNSKVTIKQIASPESGGKQVSLRTKGKAIRRVRIPEDVMRDLAVLIEGKAPSAPVFVGARGGRLGFCTLRRWFVRDMKAAGLTPGEYVIHQFRHTFATESIVNGIAPNVLAELLGHSSPNITWDVYAHVIPGAMEAAVDTVAASYARRIAKKRATKSTTQPSIPVLEPIS